MEKQIYFHPITVEDNDRCTFFTCTIINRNPATIETMDDLRATIKSYGEEKSSLNCNGCFKSNVLINYSYCKDGDEDIFKLRYVDKITGRIEEILNPEINPNSMTDNVMQII